MPGFDIEESENNQGGLWSAGETDNLYVPSGSPAQPSAIDGIECYTSSLPTATVQRPAIDGIECYTSSLPAAVAQRPAAHDKADENLGDLRPATQAPAPHNSAPKVSHLPAKYKNEQNDATFFRKEIVDGLNNGRYPKKDPTAHFDHARTRYLDPAEQTAATVSVDDHGLLHDGSGAKIDTAGSSGAGTVFGLGAGKHIYAMTPAGTVRAIDAWDNRSEETSAGAAAPDTIALVNHSSLMARQKADGTMKGGDAAAAGELRVADGKLEQVTDASGHYLPGNELTHQALEHFEEAGVDMHDVAVKLIPKHGRPTLDGPSSQRFLHASAREFMSYGGANDAEQQMRDQRASLGGELSQKVAERASRLAHGKQRVTEGKHHKDAWTTAALRDPRANVPGPGVVKPRVGSLVDLFEGMY